MSNRLVILACGNESRGDDALGPLLLGRIHAQARPEVDCVLDFQLNIEHALDMVGAELVLFIDADVSAEPPFRFERLAPEPGQHYSTHALPPASVLAVYKQLNGAEPPPAFVLGVRGDSFELGTTLSRQAVNNMEAAEQFLDRLLAAPDADAWQALAAELSHA